MRRRLFVAAVLFFSSVCVEAMSSGEVVNNPYLRFKQLQNFFQKRGCPAAAYAREFIQISLKYSLDWRLVPAIALIESTGGKHVLSPHNWFGWDSGRASFRSVGEAIDTVAQHLAEDIRYRGKTVRQKLAMYNHHAEYPGRVMAVMKQMGSTMA